MRKLQILLFILSLSACTVITERQQIGSTDQKTQLQTREYQTREFDTNNTKLVLKAVLNVLQDDGFVVKNAVTDLGLLTAAKEIDMSEKSKDNDNDVWAAIFESMLNSKSNRNSNNNQQRNLKKFKTIEVSVNVTEIGSRSKVRANFQAKIIDETGNTLDVYVIDDMKFYQDFFGKVDKGIFLQKQGL